jgi:hypothetical protein
MLAVRIPCILDTFNDHDNLKPQIWYVLCHRPARFRRRTLHVPNLIVLDATQERQ